MFGRPKAMNQQAFIDEELKISITRRLDAFMRDDSKKELAFEESLTNIDRKYIHNYCGRNHLETRSHGVEPNRRIHVYKKSDVIGGNEERLKVSLKSQQLVIGLRQYLKDTNSLDAYRPPDTATSRQMHCRTGRLSVVRPQVPRPPTQAGNVYRNFRQQLPIYEFRHELLSAIDANRVVIISGDTGCGKTTQVPQYLLEDCAVNQRGCRIVCCEPRRLAAISVAERICVERGEQIGDTIGYQIRLESKVSNNTLLTFCTNGVILRTLMSNRDDFLRNATHIIIDEVHERDRFSDFLLLILKQTLQTNPNIKLILMSATFNIKKFEDYFECESPVIEIPGRQHPVDEYFLEDVLKATNYMTIPMARYKQKLDILKRRERQGLGSTSGTSRAGQSGAIGGQPLSGKTPEQELKLKQEFEAILERVWVEGTQEIFDILIDFVSVNISLMNHKHSETGVTALICAVGHNNLNVVEALVCFGADLSVTTNDMTAYDFAQRFGHKDVCSYLADISGDQTVGTFVNQQTDEEKELLDIYHNCFNDDDIDCQLICAVLSYIMSNTNSDGAILLFLPGLEDILAVKDSIMADGKRFNPNLYEIFILHSQMQSLDQKKVFHRMANNRRKIILSTNIAETSLTIDDVVFVIDLGKVKEKSFDSLKGVSSLKSVWISQSSVRQRRGRAGRTRPGVCYHLFSKTRYRSLQRFQLPEILRIPIHEVCLQTKLLIGDNDISIHEFLSAAIDPPSITSVNQSVKLLKDIDALTEGEDLTQLGIRLLDLPIEPNYGKMLLYAVVLKCVDPVLTIVASFAYRDPFMIPSVMDKQRSLKAIKRQFYGNNSLSDHIVYLNAFNHWLSLAPNQRHAFCRQNLISNTTMTVVEGVRRQIFGQLLSAGFIRHNSDEHNRNADKWVAIKAALCAGAYPKFIHKNVSSGRLQVRADDKIRFHGSSLLNINEKFDKEAVVLMPTNWYIYEEMVQMGRQSYAKTITAVNPVTVALFAGKPVPDETQPVSLDAASQLVIDDWISFDSDAQTIKIVSFLKQELHNLFVRQIHTSLNRFNQRPEIGDSIVDTVIAVLEADEKHSGFAEVDGTSFRPHGGGHVGPNFAHKYDGRQFHSDRQYRQQKSKYKSNQRFY